MQEMVMRHSLHRLGNPSQARKIAVVRIVEEHESPIGRNAQVFFRPISRMTMIRVGHNEVVRIAWATLQESAFVLIDEFYLGPQRLNVARHDAVPVMEIIHARQFTNPVVADRVKQNVRRISGPNSEFQQSPRLVRYRCPV